MFSVIPFSQSHFDGFSSLKGVAARFLLLFYHDNDNQILGAQDLTEQSGLASCLATEKDAQHPDQTKGEQILRANTADIIQGEQPSAQVVTNEEKSLVVHNPEEMKSEGTVSMEDDLDDDELDKKPLSKIFKIMTPILNLIPLNTFIPRHLLKPEEQQKSLQEFTDLLFGTTSSKFSPTPPREPTPLRDPAKGKEVAIVKEQVNELVTYQEEGCFIPKMPKLKSFITSEGTLSQEEFNNKIKELKRISDLKAQKDKSEQELRKIADPLPITNISYTVNSNKEATMKIIRGDNPLNLIIHPNFRLKLLGFSEWLEAKFQWVMVEAKKLGLPPPSALANFGMTTEEKKRKRTQFLKKAFVTEDIRVDRMNRNLIPLPRILIRIQNQIKVDSKIADEMFRKMIYVIEARSDCIKARETVMKGLSECKASESNIRRIRVKDIVKEVEDYLKTYSSAGMDISWYVEGIR
ncbi:hypothetical protein Tco_0599422 [Tanacetum coccineum]